MTCFLPCIMPADLRQYLLLTWRRKTGEQTLCLKFPLPSDKYSILSKACLFSLLRRMFFYGRFMQFNVPV